MDGFGINTACLAWEAPRYWQKNDNILFHIKITHIEKCFCRVEQSLPLANKAKSLAWPLAWLAILTKQDSLPNLWSWLWSARTFTSSFCTSSHQLICVTGLMRKTCVAETRAAGASSSQVDLLGGWLNGTQDRNYARASLQTCITKAAGFAKDFREHHYLGRAEVPVPRDWYNALLPGLTTLLDTMFSLPCGVAETLQCIELFVEAFWQALPIRMLKYGPDFQLKQLTAVQDVMDTDAYAVFATEVGQTELDSMDKTAWKCPTCLNGQTSKQLPSALLRAGPQMLSLPLNDKE